MIGQQYYTRERRGLFRSSEGFDSIAKSKGLSDNFIKNNLQPFCFYNPPKDLENSGENDESKYPEAFSFYQVETGELVLGRSVYVAADFTGLRSAFFAHNYIISGAEKEKYLKKLPELIFAADFVRSYDIEKGKELPQLAELPWDEQTYKGIEISELFDKLGINKEIFQKLLYALIMSVTTKKKVYIALDVKLEEIAYYSRALLKYLLQGLPYELRRSIGYITYMREPESKMYINLAFVEQGKLRPGDSRVERDYVFDLAQGRFANIDIVPEAYPYLEFVWENIESYEKLEGFYQFAVEIAQDLKPDKKLILDTYNELCSLYQIRCGKIAIFNNDKKGIMASAFNYIDASNAQNKRGLIEILTMIFRLEENCMRTQGQLPDVGIVELLMQYLDFATEDIKNQINQYLLRTIILSAKSYKKDYGFELLQKAAEREALFKFLIDGICDDEELKKSILEGYLEQRLSKTKGQKELLDEIEFWCGRSERVITNPYFQLQSSKLIAERLDNSANKIGDLKAVHNFFNTKLAAAGLKARDKKSFKQYRQLVLGEADEVLLKGISLMSLSKEDLRLAEYIEPGDTSPKALIIKDLYELIYGNSEKAIYQIEHNLRDYFVNEYNYEIKRLIKSFMLDNISRHNYRKILPAFIDHFDRKDAIYDYKSVLQYILINKGKDEVYEFILWSFEEGSFGYTNDKKYAEVTRQYFLDEDPEVFKNKETKKRLFDTSSTTLKITLRETEKELASPLQRFIVKYRSELVYGVVIGVLAIALIVSGAMLVRVIMGRHADSNLAQPAQTTIEKKPEQNGIIIINDLFADDLRQALTEQLSATLPQDYSCSIICTVSYDGGITMLQGIDKLQELTITNIETQGDKKTQSGTIPQKPAVKPAASYESEAIDAGTAIDGITVAYKIDMTPKKGIVIKQAQIDKDMKALEQNVETALKQQVKEAFDKLAEIKQPVQN